MDIFPAYDLVLYGIKLRNKVFMVNNGTCNKLRKEANKAAIV